jgi:hypothetical protein
MGQLGIQLALAPPRARAARSPAARSRGCGTRRRDLVTWTIPAVNEWCLRLTRTVPAVTWTIPAVNDWCFGLTWTIPVVNNRCVVTKRPTQVTRVAHSRGCCSADLLRGPYWLCSTGGSTARLPQNQKPRQAFGQPHHVAEQPEAEHPAARHPARIRWCIRVCIRWWWWCVRGGAGEGGGKR